MNEVRTTMGRPPDAHPVEFVDEPPPPSFGDAIRYVWERRVRLAKFFLGLLALGVIGTLWWSTSRVQIAEAMLSLGFKGIEKGEYPNGRKFAIADIRGPKVLQMAVKEIGKEKRFPAVDMVARGIQVQPVSHQAVVGPRGTGPTWSSSVLRDMIATLAGSTVVPIPERRIP